MAAQPVRPAGGKKKRPLAVTIATALALVVLAGVLIYLLNRRGDINEYNRILDEYVNAEPPRYEEAIAPLEAYIAKAPKDLAAEAKKTLASCYVEMGDRVELSQQKSAEWYRKADALDPGSLDESQRRMMELPTWDAEPQPDTR